MVSNWIERGHPSYVWRFGQDRRLALIREHVALEGKAILDVGCGLGAYVRRLRAFSEDVHGVDIEAERVAAASVELPNIVEAPAEHLPFPEERFDVVLLNEVIEHVDSDRQAIVEAARVLRSGGHIVVYAPNRLYPFETHGVYFRGKFVFRLVPFVNYLPDPLRRKFCPHVRAYTSGAIRTLFAGTPATIVHHSYVYPGFDNIVYDRPRLGSLLRGICYRLEQTPLRAFGLSHFVVARVDHAPVRARA